MKKEEYEHYLQFHELQQKMLRENMNTIFDMENENVKLWLKLRGRRQR